MVRTQDWQNVSTLYTLQCEAIDKKQHFTDSFALLSGERNTWTHHIEIFLGDRSLAHEFKTELCSNATGGYTIGGRSRCNGGKAIFARRRELLVRRMSVKRRSKSTWNHLDLAFCFQDH
eukprot:scaffold14497_cov119-Cylindrotheca_fusiformis.AAC.6